MKVDEFDPDDAACDDGHDLDDEAGACHECGGDGYVMGEDIADRYDYGWIDPSEVYTCPCCNGSGKAEDCTYW